MIVFCLFLAALTSICVSQPVSQVFNTGLVQFEFADPVSDRNAVPYADFKLLQGRLSMDLQNIQVTSDGTTADIILTVGGYSGGSCPIGYEATFATKNIACSFQTGWVEEPQCLPVQCTPGFNGLTTNCTEESYDYETVCEFTCEGDPTKYFSTCASSKQFIGDTSCNTGGNMLTCGNNAFYNLGTGTNANVMHPAKSTISGMLTWPSTIEHVALGLSFMVAAGSDGVVRCVGRNSNNQCGGGADPVTTPKIVFSASAYGVTIREIVSALYCTHVITTTGRSYSWGRHDYKALLREGGDPSVPSLVPLPEGRSIEQVKVGIAVVVYILDNNDIYGGGYNSFRTISTAEIDILSATVLGKPSDSGPVKTVELSNVHFAVLFENGNLYVRSAHTSFANVCGTNSSQFSGLTEAFTHSQGVQSCAVLCQSSAPVSYTKLTSMANDIDQVACFHSSDCVFLTKSGDIKMCGSHIPENGGTHSSPVTITNYAKSIVNAGCTSSPIPSISGGHYTIQFESACNKNTLFATGLNTDGLCRPAHPGAVIVPVIEAPSPILEFAVVGQQSVVIA